MKFLLPFLFILFNTSLAGEDYLKLRSYPAYPAPGETLKQTVRMQFSPSIPEDKKFEELNNLLTKISSIEGHNIVTHHVAYLSLEFSWNGKVIETGYSKEVVKNKPELFKNWNNVFEIIQEMSNQQLKP